MSEGNDLSHAGYSTIAELLVRKGRSSRVLWGRRYCKSMG